MVPLYPHRYSSYDIILCLYHFTRYKMCSCSTLQHPLWLWVSGFRQPWMWELQSLAEIRFCKFSAVSSLWVVVVGPTFLLLCLIRAEWVIFSAPVNTWDSWYFRKRHTEIKTLKMVIKWKWDFRSHFYHCMTGVHVSRFGNRETPGVGGWVGRGARKEGFCEDAWGMSLLQVKDFREGRAAGTWLTNNFQLSKLWEKYNSVV